MLFMRRKKEKFYENFASLNLCNIVTYELPLHLNSKLIKMNKLLIVGTVAFDAIETPFGKTDKILGGAGTYIGLSASFFNLQSAIVSVVGDDFPQEYLDLLLERNIDISGLEVVKGGKTFFWSGRYHNDLNSRDTLDTQLNVLADFQPKVPENYKNADVVMLGNLHPLVQSSVLDQMETKPKLVVLDTMNFWMDCALPELLDVMKRVDVITINDEEARQLSGEYSLVKAAAKIQAMGPKYVVIKKGEHGALLFHDLQVFFAPALPLEEVFDPTGAGDTFAGGFAGFITQSENVSFENMKNAIIYGSNLASFCVEKFGTERMIDLNKKEVVSRLKQFKSLTQFDIEL
jgi:sugar/nucleoside kinase (ribokinase family)